MSFLCQTPEPTPAPPATQTVVQQADPLFRDAFNRVMNRADVVAGKPYQPYGGQRIAGLTPDTQTSFGITRQNVGAYQPFVGLAGTQAAQAGLSLPQRNVGDYMNPYIQNVVDIAKREAIRGDAIAGQGRNFAARQANAFGGSRHGIVEAEAQRNLGQRLDDIQTQGLAAGYDKAMTAIDREAQNQVRSAAVLGDLGSRASQLGFADATALDAVGTRQQQQEQANLDLAYKDFLAQRDYERDQVRFLSDIMNRAPQSAQMSSTQTEKAQFTPQASPISQAAGLASAGLGAYGLGKWAGLFKEGGAVSKYADGGLVDLPDAELSTIFGNINEPADRRNAARAELMRRRGAEPQQQFQRRDARGVRGRAVNPIALSEMPAPEPPALAPRYAAPDVEENTPNPNRPTGTTNISAIPPEITLGGMAPTRPTFQAPAAPSLANIRMPQAPGEVDYTQRLNQILGNLPTAARARERVAETKFDPVKDPNEGLPRWVMPVLRAGLAMMQAKPGQSALAGIGAGAEAGMTQAMQDREEARKIEAENQRRRERAQDLTERARDRAAQDASTVRNEAFQAGRMAMDQGRMSFDRYKAQLDTALAEKRLTIEQYNAALRGAELGLSAQRVELERERNQNLARYYASSSVIEAEDGQGNLVLVDRVTGKRTAVEGTRPRGTTVAGARNEAALRRTYEQQAKDLILRNQANFNPAFTGMTDAQQTAWIENYVRRRMAGEPDDTIGKPPPVVIQRN